MESFFNVFSIFTRKKGGKEKYTNSQNCFPLFLSTNESVEIIFMSIGLHHRVGQLKIPGRHTKFKYPENISTKFLGIYQNIQS